MVAGPGELRRTALRALGRSGWAAVAIENPTTAFHYACRQSPRLGAVVIDEGVGAPQAQCLLRRLLALRNGEPLDVLCVPGGDPTLRSIVARGDAARDESSPWLALVDAWATSVPCEAGPTRAGLARADRPAVRVTGTAGDVLTARR